MEATGLIAEAHGRAFRILCAAASRDFVGLGGAVRGRRWRDVRLRRQMPQLDVAMSLMRHISGPRGARMEAELLDELYADHLSERVGANGDERSSGTCPGLARSSGAEQYYIGSASDLGFPRALSEHSGLDVGGSVVDEAAIGNEGGPPARQHGCAAAAADSRAPLSGTSGAAKKHLGGPFRVEGDASAPACVQEDGPLGDPQGCSEVFGHCAAAD